MGQAWVAGEGSDRAREQDRQESDQVAGELRRLARFLPNTKILTLCGGQPFGMQRDSL
ncbi:hypothetical protein INR04_19435, partial [Escherichia coli]|nr:hypothetical protein [Escherichia coli]